MSVDLGAQQTPHPSRRPYTASPPRLARAETGLLLLIILVAFALRLIQLGAGSLWYDETVSTYLAGQPAAELIAHTGRDIHPPGYYLLLRGWLLLGGYPTGQADADGQGLEFMAAFLSLCCGVLLAPLTWQLARRLRLERASALLAALLVAISPFGVWYSQEVRMYTLGAALGVVCLVAATAFLGDRLPAGRLWRAAGAFALAAAAGLYALYYFAFLLISLNLLIIPLLWRRWRAEAGLPGSSPVSLQAAKRRLALWLAAQAGALLLYLPWLPVAWRQVANPPVPPWRTAPPLTDVIVESWAALSFGQSTNPARFWPLLLLTFALVVIGLLAARQARRNGRAPISGHRRLDERAAPDAAPVEATPASAPAALLLLVAAFGPPLLILLASLATPLYHVRYLFTYSPAFSVLLAMGLVAVGRWRPPASRWLAGACLALLLLGSALALRSFWADPAYAVDDHRRAARELAQRWRPGDVILVNAGYAYPALLTYWPLPVAWHGRLTDYRPEIGEQAAAAEAAVILQTGHIDGDSDLGWGDPRSDFYALPLPEAQTALRDLSAHTDRLWHYRIYDTVNDPQGALRNALARGWALVDDRVYQGEANLRVQGWQGMRQALSSYHPPVIAAFDSWLDLAMAPDAVPAQVEAGGAIDIPGVVWSHTPDGSASPAALSLRLTDAAGEVWAAHDEPLGGNQRNLTNANELVQPLRLMTPAGTAPGRYDLALVVYDPQTGQPLPAVTAGSAGSQIKLGQVEVTRPAQSPPEQPALADFGAIHLVEATTPATLVSPGDIIPLDLLWQAAAGYSAEPLVVVVQLLEESGVVVASLEEEPLQGRRPTVAWQPGELVRDRHRLNVPAGAEAGDYRLVVGLYRAADGERLSATGHPLGGAKKDLVELKKITVR